MVTLATIQPIQPPRAMTAPPLAQEALAVVVLVEAQIPTTAMARTPLARAVSVLDILNVPTVSPVMILPTHQPIAPMTLAPAPAPAPALAPALALALALVPAPVPVPTLEVKLPLHRWRAQLLP